MSALGWWGPCQPGPVQLVPWPAPPAVYALHAPSLHQSTVRSHVAAYVTRHRTNSVSMHLCAHGTMRQPEMLWLLHQLEHRMTAETKVAFKCCLWSLQIVPVRGYSTGGMSTELAMHAGGMQMS